jgi:spoIIIJ-associated protein
MEPKIFKGKTVEEATEEALKTLETDLENLEIKIIDTGRAGILGLGGHPAEIEVYEIGSLPISKPTTKKPTTTKPTTTKPTTKKPTTKRSTTKKEVKIIDNSDQEKDVEVETLVGEVLNYFIQSTDTSIDVYVRDDVEEGSIVFELEGDDAGLVIGRRGETLASIEYLVRLIASKSLGRRANVIIDVEDYKFRRRSKLKSIAEKSASKVEKTGKRISLEPMSPADRRIVHMALVDYKNVKTQSRGEGVNRKVVIIPVED